MKDVNATAKRSLFKRFIQNNILYVYKFHITKYKDPNESTLPNLLYDPVNIVCIEEY